MKDEQAKEKAHPKGTSKILAKARKKALEEEEAKKGQGQIKVTVSILEIFNVNCWNILVSSHMATNGNGTFRPDRRFALGRFAPGCFAPFSGRNVPVSGAKLPIIFYLIFIIL
jgi:hypothetical protein